MADCYHKLAQFFHEASTLASHHRFPAVPPPGAPAAPDTGDGGAGFDLGVAAVRCYQEGLRRGTFAARAAAYAAGSGLLPAAPSPSGSAALAPGAAAASVSGNGLASPSTVPLLSEDVVALVVEETQAIVRRVNGIDGKANHTPQHPLCARSTHRKARIVSWKWGCDDFIPIISSSLTGTSSRSASSVTRMRRASL